MEIRRAVLEDEDRVLGLLRQFPPEEVTVGWDAAGRAFRQIVKNPDLGSIFVAAEKEEVLGVISISFPSAVRCGGVYSCIEEFIVSDQARGKGIGGKLVEAAIAQARAKGGFELQINNPSPLGYPVYLRHGFKDIGKHLKMELRKTG